MSLILRYREGYQGVRNELFKSNPPASTIPGALIEIEAIAVVDG